MAKVWIDMETGTYGDTDSLVVIDVPENILDQWDSGQATDSDISEYARTHQ